MKKFAALALMTAMTASTAQAFSEDELVVWIGGDKAFKGLAQVGERFEEELGVKVRVENPEGITDRFQQSASAGQGPDIILWAHDRMGGWADAGLISAVEPSDEFKSQYSEMGWDAMTHNGKVYGYPVSLEAIGLLYNKDIVAEAPSSFEEMLELNKKLAPKDISTIIWPQMDAYFSMPFFTANGGYVFKRENGSYNVKDTGLNSEGSKIGGKMMLELIEQGAAPRGTDFAIAEAQFAAGKAATIIAGPWSWSNFDKLNMNYGVAPLPTINGKPAKAFVGVWGAMVNKASPNAAIAQEFMEKYVMTTEGLQTMNKDVPVGVAANKEYMKTMQADPRIAAAHQSVNQGQLMPSVPEMGRFWSSFTPSLENMITGRETVDKALDKVAAYVIASE